MLSALKLCLLFSAVAFVSARRFQPLMADGDGSNRRNTRPAECQFGKTLRELGSTWNADLGPPFGVMYCIRCECVPVIKRRRVIARAQCRNIKHECPKVACDEPVQLAGTCCKVCPQTAPPPIEQTAQDVPADLGIDDATATARKQYYGALMTGRTSAFMRREEIKTDYVIENPLNIVATGRFVVERKNLYFSFYISNRADRPRAIQFVDDTGYILQEIILVQPKRGPASVYQNVTGKVCGVWRRIPHEYQRMLDEAKMNIVMLWGGKYQAELALAGKISGYPALDAEVFSSLMEPTTRRNARIMNGAGGTASISIISPTMFRAVLILNGLFTVQDVSNVSLNVHLDEVDSKRRLLTHTVVVSKPAHDYNVIDFTTLMKANTFKLMARGKVSIIVESRRRPKALRIEGPVLTRATCELFETLLTNSTNGGSGYAWMYFNRDGSIVYSARTEEETPAGQVALVDGRTDRNISRMTSAEAFIDHLEPNDFLSLYASQLAVKISGAQSMKGRLVAHYVADARDSNQPFLLHRINESANGMAWMSVDNECTLHYSVVMNGAPINRPFTLQLEEKPMEAPGAPIAVTTLEEFTGSDVNGFVLSMPSHELIKLDTSICYLLVKTGNETLARGKVRPPGVPRHCQFANSDNSLPMLPNDDAEPTMAVAGRKCFHSGQFYDEGAQWRNALETCSMCSCSQSAVRCEAIKCPTLLCSAKSVVPAKDGQCCASCAVENPEPKTNSTASRGCDFGGQFHSPGTSWHPYLPPNGFDMCTVCTCDASTLDVRCPRLQCPPLNCSDSEAYRPSPKACCKVCPAVKQENRTVDTEFVGDQQTPKLREDTVKSGGCKVANSIYENGREWHPIVGSIGEQQCVVCQCKDSQVTCDRKQCNRVGCKASGEKGKKRCCTVDCRRTRQIQRKDRDEKQKLFKTASAQIRKLIR